MPTPEERLTTLEYDFDQFKAETTTYYQEMALQVTMSKGLTEDAVKRLMQLRVQMDKRFSSIDQQLTGVKQDLTGVKQDLTGVKQDLTGVKQDLTGVKQDLTGVKQDLTGVKQDILDLHAKFDQQRDLLLQVLARLAEKP